MVDLTPRPQSPGGAPDSPLTVRIRSVRAGASRRGAPLAEPPADNRLGRLDQLVRKRLDLVRGGLREACRQLWSGRDDEAAVLVEKLDEDLAMLQHRVRREVEAVAVHGSREP
jgi:hypothetical protein